MPVLRAPAAATHELGGARFTTLAAPSRGSTDTSVWKVEIRPGTPATPHSLTRQEVFVVLRGTASVQIAGEARQARAGDAIVVPADAEFELANAGSDSLELLCCMPVGGQARLADGCTFVPPWAE